VYIFKHSTVIGVYITMFVNGFIFFSSLFYLPQFFQVGLGYSPMRSGIFLLPVLVTQTLASFAAGMIVSKTGRYRNIIHSGFAVWAIGCGCISTIRTTSPKAVIVIFMLLAGTGAGQTLQTTTIAVQASVSRRDMSVVTAVRNFIRLLGGTLSLAVGASITNNSMRRVMTSLSLPTSSIDAVIDNPVLLGSSYSTGSLSSLGITKAAATRILSGYINGFRVVFILNASLSVCATLASVCLIKHKELTRGDEEDLKARAREEGSKTPDRKIPVTTGDLEMMTLASGDTDRQNVVHVPSVPEPESRIAPFGACRPGGR